MSSCYFDLDFLYKWSTIAQSQRNQAFLKRRDRTQLPGFSKNPSWGLRFGAGDVLKLFYDRGPTTFSFEGLCLNVKNRGFGRKQTMVRVRNVMVSVGVEILTGYFLRRLYKLSFSDHKRKLFEYNKTHLYFVRHRLNKQSRVR